MKTMLTILSILCLAGCAATRPDYPAALPPPALATPSPAAPAPLAIADSPLRTYHWQLAAAVDAAGHRIDALFARADAPLQLDFDASSLSVSHTCNRMHGAYALDRDELVIAALAATLMACPEPALMELDAAVGKLLQGTLTLALAADQTTPKLVLTTSQGDVLHFVGSPTAVTRFGSAGETAFLEIAADDVPCKQANPPGVRCLKVRALTYGSRGLRTGQPGPWQVLDHGIEGFVHQPGVRNVLRVRHHRISNPPAAGASSVYVLELVIETHTPQ